MPLFSWKEKESFHHYRTARIDRSLSTWVFGPLWDRLADLIPESVSPNVVSLVAFLCLFQAWYTSYKYGERFPLFVTVTGGLLVAAFYTLDQLDDIHARRTGNNSALVEFFDHACSTVGSIFLVLLGCQCLGVASLRSQWYMVQIIQLVVLYKHLGVFAQPRVHHAAPPGSPVRSKRKKKDDDDAAAAAADAADAWVDGPETTGAIMTYRLLAGPGEAIFAFLGILAVRVVFGAGMLQAAAGRFCDLVNEHLPGPGPILPGAAGGQEGGQAWCSGVNGGDAPVDAVIQALFAGVYVVMILRVLVLPAKHSSTRLLLLIVLLLRLIPVGSLLYIDFGEMTTVDVIASGLFTSLLTADIVSSRFADRELHPWVVVLAMAGVTSNVLNILLAFGYYAMVCHEICDHTHQPLLTVNINVYCDGIYDMCHVGHMKAYENAAKNGTRLFVGVCGDEDATPYKRAPIMSTAERCAVVERCKYVYKVIPNAPCVKGALDLAFIRKHNIHIVCCGQEYQDNPNDEWYAVPRKLGILRTVPRTGGISTSDLINRIQERGAGGKEVKAASD